MAPRPTLLTYNAKDTCCFRADYAVAPLVQAAAPIFSLLDAPGNLRHHVNHDPGHNYGLDNRQAFYGMLRDHFFGGSGLSTDEIALESEVRPPKQLHVPLPAGNLDFQRLALDLSRDLPRQPILPADRASAIRWQTDGRARLRRLVSAKDFRVLATATTEKTQDFVVTAWRLRMGGSWTVPAVELATTASKETAILVADTGFADAASHVQRLLAEGHRVVAMDPFYFGQSRMGKRDFLFALLVASLGDHPLGIQAGQLAAAARWIRQDRRLGTPSIVAVGPRASLIAAIAAALEPEAIAGVELNGSMGTLKEVLEQNLAANETPELFCFGLLEQFDLRQLIALAAPRPVVLSGPSERVRNELGGLDKFYAVLGRSFNPLSNK
jgi:hypothetical protein